MKKRSKRSKSATGAARRPTTTRSRDPRYPPARRRFGQHFLEPAWVARLIGALDPLPTDSFLEIGPGRGALTAALAPRVRRVIAVEIDRDLAAALPAHVPGNVDVVTGDFLEVDLEALLRGEMKPVRVVGNLPYNVSSPILLRLLAAADDGRRFRDATVMLQKEVADRIAAPPGARDYGVLAIQTGLVADVERILILPPGAFRPPPKVTSAVVQLRFRAPAAAVDRAMFERLVRSIFLHRRKTLLNALRPMAEHHARSAEEMIARARLDPRQRPETLTVGDVVRLSAAVL